MVSRTNPGERHSFHPAILREYDIRGTVGDNLTAADAHAVGRAFGSELAEAGGGIVCVGQDGRDSTPMLEAAVVTGLQACGLEVHRIGLGPTPMLHHAVRRLGAVGGVMVTGSHNAAACNGFKLVRGTSCLTAECLRRLAERAAQGNFVRGDGRVVQHPMAVDYVEHLAGHWDVARPPSVAWDPGNGAVAAVLPLLLRRIPGRQVVINGEVDGSFPAHHPDPADEHNLRQLKDMVLAEGTELGLAFDGDGDRIGVTDDLGRVLWADQLLAILAEDVLQRHPGAAVVGDVKASQVLFDEVRRCGGNPVMARAGRPFILRRMGETGAVLGGEMSGHIFFADPQPGYDDALYAAIRLIGLVSRLSGETLSGRIDRLPHRLNTPEMRLPCAEERKTQVVAEVRQRLRDEAIAFDDTDGVRVTSADGWWLLRASNTEAALTARCEALSPHGLKELRRQLAEQLRQSGVASPWGG